MVLGLLIAGGVALASLGGLGLVFNKQQVKKQQELTKQAQIDYAKTQVLSKLTPEQATTATATALDDFYLTAREYAPYILTTIGVVVGAIIILKKN